MEKKENLKKIKNTLPFLVMIALAYYVIPRNSAESEFIVYFLTIPLVCFGASILYGINNSFNELYSVFVATIFFPSVIVVSQRYDTFFFLPIIYVVIALAGNAIGKIFYKRNVRIKHLEKIGKYFVIAVIVCYIAAVIVSAVMMSRMNRITYEAVAYGLIYDRIVLDFEENTVRQASFNFDEDNDERESHGNPISNSESARIRIVCSFALFPLWHGSYDNSPITGGHTYRIYVDGEMRVRGRNTYPLTYNLVMRVIKNALTPAEDSPVSVMVGQR